MRFRHPHSRPECAGINPGRSGVRPDLRDHYPDLKPDDIRVCAICHGRSCGRRHPPRGDGVNLLMKFLADQDVYAATTSLLKNLGHDVATAADLGMSVAKDFELLRTAHDQGRIFVTRDRDFGALVFVRSSGPGVIYLRILPATQQAVHAELTRILSIYIEQQLQAAFVVVEPARHRIRKV